MVTFMQQELNIQDFLKINSWFISLFPVNCEISEEVTVIDESMLIKTLGEKVYRRLVETKKAFK